MCGGGAEGCRLKGLLKKIVSQDSIVEMTSFTIFLHTTKYVIHMKYENTRNRIHKYYHEELTRLLDLGMILILRQVK